MHEDTKWHWEEGFKYANEAVKTLFIINGAAAVSILTFIGNTKAHYSYLIFAMICFALGAATSACVQTCAYLTQLHYGNASQLTKTDPTRRAKWNNAETWHYVTYIFAGAGLVLFLAGVAFAAQGLYAFGAK